MSDAALRRALVEAARKSVLLGLNHGTTGNLSARSAAGFLITPTGQACDAIGPDELVHVNLEGGASGGRTPSSEWRLHRDIYRLREDVHAVVHAHPTFCTTLACLRRDLPPVHYLIAVAGGAVRCSTYATFATEELSRAAVAALDGRRACLLANHGMVAVGDNPEDALRVAWEVERVAEYYWRALAVGEPAVLTPSELALALSQFRSYGRGQGPERPPVS